MRREADALLVPLEEAEKAEYLAAVEVNRKEAAKLEQAKKWRSEGRCLHCGVRLSMLPGGMPTDAAVYCSNCGGRVN